MDLAKAPMAPAAAAAPAPSSPQFPAGLRVLVVDDDLICLKILEKMLRRCLYEATTCSRAAVALSMLRERRGAFDLVLSDVYMPDMDGFKLLEHIGLEMDLPVIMMSADDGKDVVMKGVTHGACDYLIKPVRIEALKNIWQHVVRKKRNELREVENSGSMDESDKQKRMMDDVDNASSVNEGSWKNVKRRKDGKDDDDDVDDHEDSSTLKKPRVVWSVELHQQFVTAVNQLGVEKAVPKKILDLMNVPGLTRENVASHLQKYRLYLRRVSLPQHQGRYDGSFSGATDGSFGSSSSLDGFDLQALAFSGQLPAQSLISMHAGSRRVTNTPTGMPAVDQISFLNSEAQIANSARVRSSPGQLLNNKQLNFLSGMPANIESTQLGLSHPPVLSYGNISLQVTEGMSGFMNLPSSLRTPSPFSGETINGHLGNAFAVQGQQFSVPQQQNHIPVDMPGQSQLRGQLRNGFKGEQNSVFLPTMEQQLLSNEVSDNIPGKGGIAMNGKSIATSYGAAPQVQFAAFQNNNIIESTRSCFPPASTMRASNYTSTGMLQEDIHAMGNVEPFSNSVTLKGVKDFLPNYNLLGEPPMNKNQDWRLQNANFPYESSQHLASKQSNIDFRSSSSLHKDFNATTKDGRRNPHAITKLRTELEQNGVHIAPSKQAYLVENSVRVKAETVTDPRHQDIIYDDNIMHNELMGIIGTQQGVGEGETEFNFDGYPLDDIPV